MNRNQVVDLLSLIVAHDNRTLSETDVAMWGEHATRGRWEWDDARDAVIAHFAHSTDWIKPAHINALIKARRGDRHARTPLTPAREPRHGPPSSPETVRTIMGQLCAELGWKPTHSVILAVACPTCEASSGAACAPDAPRGRTGTPFHPARRAAAHHTLHEPKGDT